MAQAAVVGVPSPRWGEVGRAFIVATLDAHLDAQTVIAHAREHLANYKVPRSVVFLDELPRNASGKVLKTTLRKHGPDAPAAGPTPQCLGGWPVGPVEHWVADAWQDLLNISRPGRRDAFTDLGGDSLAAVEFSDMLWVQLGVRMSVDSLAERPTIAEVVAGLPAAGTEQRQPIVHLRTNDAGPVCLLVPGIGGHAWKFVPLAKALSGPCEVLALSLTDLRDGPAEELRTRIQQAAHEALAPAVGSGRPIVVAGYSFGAMIAADLTCWLTAHNVPVTKLLLLDPDPLNSAAPHWDSRTSRMSHIPGLVFVPGSPAARQLDLEVSEMSTLLQKTYLNRPIRLPNVPVSWIQSRMMATAHQEAATVFGTPVDQIAKDVLELSHLGIVEIPGVRQLAHWVDGELAPKST